MEVYFCRHPMGRGASSALLAWAVRERWGLKKLPELARGAFGKPYFPGLEGRYFNLSHSGTLLVCVLDRAPVGADVQLLRPPRPRLPQRIFSPAELDWYQAQGGGAEPFCRLWVMKEARVKHDGAGLTYPLRGVPVPLPPEQGCSARRDALVFTPLTGEDWRGAVCAARSPERTVWVPPDALECGP